MYKYDPYTNELVWVPYNPTPQMGPQEPQQPQAAGVANQAAGLAGQAAGMYGMGQLLGGGGAAVAPVATSMGAMSAPSMAMPALTMMGAPSAVGAGSAGAAGAGAIGAGSTAGAGAGAGLTLGSIAAPVAAVAGPILLGKLIDKTFFGQKPKRQYNVDEVAQDLPGFNKLATQVKGYQNLELGKKKELLNALHGAKLLALPGNARIENGQAITEKRTPEYINWSRYLRDPRGGSEAANDRTSRWYNPVGQQPSEDDINKAYWLKDSKRKELLGALAAIKQAEGSTNA